jgi:hypothetical protein
MSAQKALLLELFAILLVLYGGFTVLAPEILGDRWAIYASLYLGVFGLIYGLVADRVAGAFRNGK